MIFNDFDNAVEYYERAALKTVGRFTNLHAAEVSALAGIGVKTVINQVTRQGNTKDYSIQDVVRWLIDSDRIRVGNIVRMKKVA